MEETVRQRALDAMVGAHKDLLSAWKHLSGRRLPLAGVQHDLDKAKCKTAGWEPEWAKDATARDARSAMPCNAAEARTSFRISVQIPCM
jgi:hypothetical protein